MPSNHTACPLDLRVNPIYSTIWSRLYFENRNFLAAFCGQTGAGKSYSAMSMAWAVDRSRDGKHRFNVDRVAFTVEEFLGLIRQNLPTGSFIVWDEVGVGINARKFYDNSNILVSYITQTFRRQNLGVLYTVPAFNYVDKQVRQLFHAYIELSKPDQEAQLSRGKWHWIDYNPKENNKIYWPFPRVHTKIGEPRLKVKGVSFPLPPKELLDQYEEKKKAMTEKWYAEYQEMLEKKVEGGKNNEHRIIQDVRVRIDEYWDVKKDRVDPTLLMVDFGISRTRAYDISNAIKLMVKRGDIVV